MPAFLQQIADDIYVLRVGRNAVKMGDPYTASGTVQVDEEGVPVVMGFTRRDNDLMTAVEIWRDIQKCMKEQGFSHFKWERIRKNGSSHWIIVKTD
jgi:hypothetical protein